jgi:hypothetical protein
MTATQQRTYDEQLAHEDSLIDSWSHEEKDIIDLGDLDDAEGFQYHDDDYMIGCYPEDDIDYSGLYDDGDHSME